MNVVNKMFATVMLVVLLAAAIVVFVLRVGLVSPSVIAYGPLHRIATDLASSTESGASLVLVIAIVVAIVALILLLAEVRPRGARGLRIREEGSTHYADVSPRVLADAATRYISDVKGVSSVSNVRVRVARGALAVSGYAVLTRFADEAATTVSIQQAVSTHLQRFTGVPVESARVEVSREAPAPSRASTRPTVR